MGENMNEEIREYIKFLLNSQEIERPAMPKFDVSAYADYNYVSTISSILNDFDLIDDFAVTIEFLQGE